jgi:hypothetical protein
MDKSWADADRTLPVAKTPGRLISLLDADQKVSDLFGSYQFPETYLVEASGKIRTKWIGPQAWDSETVRAAIRDLDQSRP